MLLFLLLGAIINIAVAWWFSFNGYVREQYFDEPEAVDIEWWQHTAPAGVSDKPARVIRSSGLGHRGTYMTELIRSESNPTSGHTCSRDLLGWPMHSLEWTRWSNGPRIFNLRGVLVFPKFWLLSTNQVVMLPIEPRWGGALVNSTLYGSILFIGWIGLRTLRRRRRVRKGLCPQCKYPIGTSDICTECGKPVRRKTEPQQTETA